MSEKTIILKIPVIIEKCKNGYYAHTPIFKGIHIDGETEEEVEKNFEIAVKLYIKSLIEHSEPIPTCIIEKKREFRKNRPLKYFDLKLAVA